VKKKTNKKQPGAGGVAFVTPLPPYAKENLLISPGIPAHLTA